MSSGLHPGLDPDIVAWAARETVRMHREPSRDDRATGACKQCQPSGGCPQLAWALGIIIDGPASRAEHHTP